MLAGLVALALPPLLVRRAVGASVQDIGQAVQAEDMPALEKRFLPSQRAMARSLIAPVLPGHGESLERLRVTGMERLEDGSYSVHAVFSFDDASWGRQIIEARMRMRREAGEWLLDLQECEARQFSLTESGGWTKATDWLNLAQP